MTSLLAKVAVAAALTVATIAGLIGISGSIIFADVRAPERASIVQEQNLGGGASKPLTFNGPRQ